MGPAKQRNVIKQGFGEYPNLLKTSEIEITISFAELLTIVILKQSNVCETGSCPAKALVDPTMPWGR